MLQVQGLVLTEQIWICDYFPNQCKNEQGRHQQNSVQVLTLFNILSEWQ